MQQYTIEFEYTKSLKAKNVGTPNVFTYRTYVGRFYHLRFAKFCVQNRVRSRGTPCCPLVHGLLASLRGPQHLCRVSACCAA